MALDPRELRQFITQAQIKLTGASESGILVELYDVLKEFFGDSKSWTEDIAFTPVANTTVYTLAPREEGQITDLVGVWDEKMIPVPAFMRTRPQLQLVSAPNPNSASVQWLARVCKNVTLPTTSGNAPIGPDWVLRVYSVHILDGLLGKMMGQENKSYSNSQMAAYHLKRFRQGIAIARVDAQHDNQMGAQAWAFPRATLAHGSQRGGVSTAFPGRFF